MRSIKLIKNYNGREGGASISIESEPALFTALNDYKNDGPSRILLQHSLGSNLDIAIENGYMSIEFNSADYEITLYARRSKPLPGIKIEFWNEGNQGFIESPLVFPFAEALEIVVRFFRTGKPPDFVEWVW